MSTTSLISYPASSSSTLSLTTSTFLIIGIALITLIILLEIAYIVLKGRERFFNIRNKRYVLTLALIAGVSVLTIGTFLLSNNILNNQSATNSLADTTGSSNITAQVFCQDPGGTKYLIPGATLQIQENLSTTTTQNYTTDSNGSVSTSFFNNGQSFTEIGVRLLNLPSGSLPTGIAYSQLSKLNAAINCSNASLSGCSGWSGNYCGQSNASYETCNINNGQTDTNFVFNLTGCGTPAPKPVTINVKVMCQDNGGTPYALTNVGVQLRSTGNNLNGSSSTTITTNSSGNASLTISGATSLFGLAVEPTDFSAYPNLTGTNTNNDAIECTTGSLSDGSDTTGCTGGSGNFCSTGKNDYENCGIDPTNTSTKHDFLFTLTNCNTSGTIACGPIDVDNDGSLNIVDFTAFAKDYGSSCNDNYPNTSGTCGGKDTNSDGVINVVDLSSFAQRYGKPSCALP